MALKKKILKHTVVLKINKPRLGFVPKNRRLRIAGERLEPGSVLWGQCHIRKVSGPGPVSY
jgi:hypothetical protein